MQLIELQFSDARKKAQKLKETATELRNMANYQYTDAIRKISSNWKSDSANMYIAKAEKLKEDILKSAKRLEDIASNILKTVQTMENAERAAQELARIRKY